MARDLEPWGEQVLVCKVFVVAMHEVVVRGFWPCTMWLGELDLPEVATQFWLNFWSRQMWQPPGLTDILVPDSNTRAKKTPSYHNHQRQVGLQRFWPCTIG